MADPGTDDLAFKTRIMREVVEAIGPYERQLEELKRDLERSHRYGEEDRVRLAATLREENERNAEQVADKIVRRAMLSLGLDPDRPADFMKLTMFVKEMQDTVQAARRHGLLVVTLIWTGVKGNLKP